MKTRKLIVLDIDGTPYNGKEALIAAQECGHVLVLASGGPIAGLKDMAEELELERHNGLLLGYNGGLATDCTSGIPIYSKTIPVSTARALAKHLEGFPAILMADDGKTLYTDRPDAPIVARESYFNHLEIKPVPNVRAAISFSPVRMLIFMPAQKMMKYRADMESPFTGELSFSLSKPFLLEAAPVGVSQVSSLEKLCALLGIPQQDVVALDAGQKEDIAAALAQWNLLK